MSDRRAFESSLPADGPRSLPFCAYPRARDVAQHGVQVLPTVLPRVDFTQAQPYRSLQHKSIEAARLTPAQILQMARVVATAFARREPQPLTRQHLVGTPELERPPKGGLSNPCR